jgi:hypothetical protein
MAKTRGLIKYLYFILSLIRSMGGEAVKSGLRDSFRVNE